MNGVDSCNAEPGSGGSLIGSAVEELDVEELDGVCEAIGNGQEPISATAP